MLALLVYGGFQTPVRRRLKQTSFFKPSICCWLLIFESAVAARRLFLLFLHRVDENNLQTIVADTFHVAGGVFELQQWFDFGDVFRAEAERRATRFPFIPISNPQRAASSDC